MPTPDTPSEIARYIGEDQFGPAYRVMLAGDAHAPRSVDRVLFQRMIRLGTATADYLYASYTPTTLRYRHGSRPKLERFLGAATHHRPQLRKSWSTALPAGARPSRTPPTA